MAIELTKAHHDWVRDAFNVDPRVYTQPDADIEAPLDDPDFLKKPTLVVEVTDLRKDFSNTVHAACKRAHDAMSELASVPWDTSDAKAGAAILAKSAPSLTKDQRAILEQDVAMIKQAVDLLNNYHDEIELAVDAYDAAVNQLGIAPEKLEERPQDKDEKKAAKDGISDDSVLSFDGDFREHLGDFINQVTQMTWKLADLHLFAGVDWAKDLLKHDDTDTKIKAIVAELDKHYAAISQLIDATRQRAMQDAERAIKEYGLKLASMKKQIETVETDIGLYHKHLESFSSKGAGGKSAPSKDAKLVLDTYNAIVDAAMATQVALHALDTKTLGPSAYTTFADQMIPLGKPVTDDARTGGASLFVKGGTVIRYDQPVAIVEALASGLEDVVLVYANAPKMQSLYDDWSKAITAPH